MIIPALPVFRTRHGSEIVGVSVTDHENHSGDIQKAKDLDIADGSRFFLYPNR